MRSNYYWERCIAAGGMYGRTIWYFNYNTF